MKTKTSELIGPALDWAVAKCEGLNLLSDGISWIAVTDTRYTQLPKYSTDWAQGGPIIEREKISIGYERYSAPDGYMWDAAKSQADTGHTLEYGPTPLVAAMRCYVASKLGDEIDIPEELQ